MESINTSGNDRSPLSIIAGVLDKFGLELNVPYQPSGIAFLEWLNCDNRSHYEANLNSTSFSPMTIDYSKLLTELQEDFVKNIRIFSLKGSSENTALEGKHTFNRYENTRSLILATIDMWIHYNGTHVTKLTFNIMDSHRYLPHATKLSSLEFLKLIGKKPVKSDLEDVISFIKHNQSAFPRKRSLKVSHWGDVPAPSHTRIVNIGGVDHDSYISNMGQFRSTILAYMRPTIKIYEVVKRPSKLIAHYIPEVYTLLQNIEVDHLTDLYDSDHYRFDMGEIGPMRCFLQKCHNLKALDVAINHPEAFPWVSQSTKGESRISLMKLERLDIIYKFSCYAAIMALNDAMTTFSTSIRTVILSNRETMDGCRPSIYARNVETLRSLHLQKLASANTIGNFPTLIPNLTCLIIQLDDAITINIGSLSNCPNLENLEIRFGVELDGISRPKGEAPTTLPGPHDLLNPNWKQLDEDFCLFPLWNLPKMQILVLGGSAALRFDFASLQTMPRLNALLLYSSQLHTKQRTLEHLFHRSKIPYDIPNISMLGDLDQQSRTYETYLTQELSLPFLCSIDIQGPSSAMFYLDHLRQFPRLKSLWLCHDESFFFELCRNPKHNQTNTNSIASDSDIHLFNDEILVESRLTHFELKGKWSMSSADLISVLTVYAPFLEALNVGELRCNGSEHARNIIEVIHQADIKNNNFADAGSQVNKPLSPEVIFDRAKQFGQQLISVNLKGKITDEEADELGIHRIDERIDQLQQVRTYCLHDDGETEEAILFTKVIAAKNESS
ncbi:hypothetical protein BGZ76_009956 [Entomortierella beljakovae]|nr:hypothetical protein BGZ76_009956 [Entomortierella beljakovae]